MRGCYLGSNVSYNVKKMVENGYLAQQRSLHDRRSIHVRLTEKGVQLRDRLTEMHRRHAEMLPQAAISAEDLQARRRDLAPARAVLDPRRRPGAAAAAIRRLIFFGDAGARGLRVCAQINRGGARMAPQLFPLAPGLSAAGRLDRGRYRRARRSRRAHDHQQPARRRRPRPAPGRRGAAHRRGARHRLSPHPDHRRDPCRAPMSTPLPRRCECGRGAGRRALPQRHALDPVVGADPDARGRRPAVADRRGRPHGIDIASLPAVAARLRQSR